AAQGAEPVAVPVQPRGGDGAGKRVAHLVDPGAAAGTEIGVDHRRDRQIGAGAAGAEPRLEQPVDLGGGEAVHLAYARNVLEQIDDAPGVRLAHVRVRLHDLDRDSVPDRRVEIGGGAAEAETGRGGEHGQEHH